MVGKEKWNKEETEADTEDINEQVIAMGSWDSNLLGRHLWATEVGPASLSTCGVQS